MFVFAFLAAIINWRIESNLETTFEDNLREPLTKILGIHQKFVTEPNSGRFVYLAANPY
jgi:hypothetical protein